MYLDFFNLKERPFHITPDPEFLYLSPYHKEALGVIIYGINQRKGFLAVLGEVGLGKTTIVRTYLKKYTHEKLKTIVIFNVNVSFKSIIKTIYKELDIELISNDTTELIENLYLILIKEFQQGFNIVLLIDEAQNMPSKTLEQLRMLSNLETSKDKLIQILLVGQPELEDKLQKTNLRQLKQRIAVKATLYPLSKKDSKDYIQHRLKHAANDNYTHVFKGNALEQIIKLSKGIPRNINIICDNALVSAFGYGKKPVTKKIINEVFKDLSPAKHKKKVKWGIALIFILLLTAGSITWLYQKNVIINIYNDLKQSVSITLYQKKINIENHPEKSSKYKGTDISSDNIPSVQNLVPALKKPETNNLKKAKASVKAQTILKPVIQKEPPEKKAHIYTIKPKSKSKSKSKPKKETDPAGLIDFLLEKYSDKNVKKELKQP